MLTGFEIENARTEVDLQTAQYQHEVCAFIYQSDSPYATCIYSAQLLSSAALLSQMDMEKISLGHGQVEVP